MQTTHQPTRPILQRRPARIFWRIIYLLTVVSFALPFLVVKGCTPGTSQAYTGMQLIGKDWMFLIPLVIGLVFFLLSFLSQRQSEVCRAFTEGWRTMLAFSALLGVWVLPTFTFLFEDVSPLQGQVIAVVAWVLLYVAGLFALWVAYRRIRSAQPAALGRRPALCRILHAMTLVVLIVGVIAPVAVSLRLLGWARWPWAAFALFNFPAMAALWFAARGALHGEQWVRGWVWSNVVLLPLAYGLSLLDPRWAGNSVRQSWPTEWILSTTYSAIVVWVWFAHLSEVAGIVSGYLGGRRDAA